MRSSTNPVSQVFKRLSEKERKNTMKDSNERKYKLHISTKFKNNCFMLHNEDFVFLIEERDSGYYVCDYLSQSRAENFLHFPAILNLLILFS